MFLGIGAMRAGTTWLHRLLSRYPDCAMPPVKELHFFTAKYLPRDNAQRYAERLAQIARRVSMLSDDVCSALAQRPQDATLFEDGFLAALNLEKRTARLAGTIEMFGIHDMASYLRYFAALRARQGACIAGEISPTYGDLPAVAFADIERHMPGTRFLFIMRDPVERFWSQVRHSERRDTSIDPNTRVAHYRSEPSHMARSDYRRIIENLESEVPRERIFYGFLERMTASISELRRLEEFLRLEPLPAEQLDEHARARENRAPERPLSEENRERIRSALDPIYAFVERRFGGLPEEWSAE
jgi:hypothetical protein